MACNDLIERAIAEGVSETQRVQGERWEGSMDIDKRGRGAFVRKEVKVGDAGYWSMSYMSSEIIRASCLQAI